MKRLIVCGLMFGLMTGVSFAQRGRAAGGVGPAVGGVGPTARISNGAPVVGTTPNAVTTTHGSTAPNAVTGSDHARTVTPNATSGTNGAAVSPNAGTATTVAPNANTVPDQPINPDAQGVSDHTRVNPNQ